MPLSMPPQLGVGAGIPKPRKLKEASAITMAGTRTVNKRITIGIIFGRICLNINLKGEEPIDTAAETYTFSLIAITALLTILDPGMP